MAELETSVWKHLSSPEHELDGVPMPDERKHRMLEAIRKHPKLFAAEKLGTLKAVPVDIGVTKQHNSLHANITQK